ncbi:MAG TPA: hypothetical protein VGK55_12365 [Actinomycetes bacterium]|jgi:hypothetical protein
MAIAWEEGGSEQDFPRYRAPLAERGAMRRRGQAKVGACKVVKDKVDDAAVEPFVAASDLGGAQPTRLEPVAFALCRSAADDGWHGAILTCSAAQPQLHHAPQPDTQVPFTGSPDR